MTIEINMTREIKITEETKFIKPITTPIELKISEIILDKDFPFPRFIRISEALIRRKSRRHDRTHNWEIKVAAAKKLHHYDS